MTTVCSTAHCYGRAQWTGDPAHPPFCNDCKPEARAARARAEAEARAKARRA